MLLWLWHRPAAAAQIRPLAWEPIYATGVALNKTKGNKITKNKKKIPLYLYVHVCVLYNLAFTLIYLIHWGSKENVKISVMGYLYLTVKDPFYVNRTRLYFENISFQNRSAQIS